MMESHINHRWAISLINTTNIITSLHVIKGTLHQISISLSLLRAIWDIWMWKDTAHLSFTHTKTYYGFVFVWTAQPPQVRTTTVPSRTQTLRPHHVQSYQLSLLLLLLLSPSSLPFFFSFFFTNYHICSNNKLLQSSTRASIEPSTFHVTRYHVNGYWTKFIFYPKSTS